MANLIVMPDEVGGWDVLREGDSQALVNLPDKESAIEAARLRLAEEGGGEVVVDESHVHRLDETERGAKLYFVVLLALLAAALIIIAVTGWLASLTLH